MGFIEEIVSITNDINYMRYKSSKASLIDKIRCKSYIRRLKKAINSINDDAVGTKLIADYAEYYLQVFDYDKKDNNMIKQITRGNGTCLVSTITFEVPMPDSFYGLITVNFDINSREMATYNYTVVGPNSVKYINQTIREPILLYDNDVDMENITKADNNHLIRILKNLFIRSLTKEIKTFLLESIEIKEISNG